MPFFDDSGVRAEEHSGPLWSAFALLADQVERMVALNIAWAIQLVPMLLALGFTEWPAWLRLALLLYTGLALTPATGALYGLIARASRGEMLRLDLAVEVLRELTLPSLTRLMPLYGGLAWLAALAWFATRGGWPVVNVLAQLALLLLALCSIYWGPLFALQADLPALGILQQSVRLLWRHPGRTLLTGLLALCALAIGLVSVGGMFLIVPVLLALLQTQIYYHTREGQRGLTKTAKTR